MCFWLTLTAVILIPCLAVYTGTVISNLTEIASNDDAGLGTNTSEVIFAFPPEETYHIAVAGKTSSDVGNIVLNYEIIPEPGLGIWILGLLELWIIGKRRKTGGTSHTF